MKLNDEDYKYLGGQMDKAFDEAMLGINQSPITMRRYSGDAKCVKHKMLSRCSYCGSMPEIIIDNYVFNNEKVFQCSVQCLCGLTNMSVHDEGEYTQRHIDITVEEWNYKMDILKKI